MTHAALRLVGAGSGTSPGSRCPQLWRVRPSKAGTEEIPLAGTMVELTTITLWSLGQSIVVTEEAAVVTGAAYSVA